MSTDPSSISWVCQVGNLHSLLIALVFFSPALIYEPTNPEASEILPLLQQKLLEGKHRFLWNTSVPRLYWECILLSSEQGTEESSEEEDDSERDERSSCTSTSSCSSSSSDTDEERRDPDDDEQEKHVWTSCRCSGIMVCFDCNNPIVHSSLTCKYLFEVLQNFNKNLVFPAKRLLKSKT